MNSQTFVPKSLQRPWLVYLLLLLPQVAITHSGLQSADPIAALLDSTGSSAFLLMALSLSLAPIRHTLRLNTNWLQRPVGLALFSYGMLHGCWYVLPNGLEDIDKPFIYLGLSALGLWSLLALTSNRRSQKILKRNWKRVHRLTYLATVLVLVHVAMNNKADHYLYIAGFAFWLFWQVAGRVRASRKTPVQVAA
ncbi:MAG: ferric reductase-like transmembrane domain-containing protein [SAR324 cluster bacterium]|jgi:sulfoxide reductase heme-binding subunit YedZ|nr:ferric reductase-like transmembrane domain-containing protein [SAR324 cluster bacterium]